MLVTRARELRRDMTIPERRLWHRLRRRALNVRFRRQALLGGYIVDFLCLEKRLVIEVDGGQHSGSEGDRRRDQALLDLGFRTLRVWNHDVVKNLQGVMAVIVAALEEG